MFTKLNEEQVIKILHDTRRIKIIADEYGVHSHTIDNIKNRKTWKHIDIKGVK